MNFGHVFPRGRLLNLGLVCCLVASLCSVNVSAAPKKDRNAPPAANIFEQYGLSKDIPKLGLSSLAQSEHLIEQMTHRLETVDGVQESQVFVVQSTDSKGNIDMRIKYDPRLLDEHENLVARLEEWTRQQYRLRQYGELFDRNSVVVDELGDERLVIRFNYSRYGLPQDIAYFRFMRVKVMAEGGEVKSMVLTNSRPFLMDGYQIKSYRQDVTFKTLETGRVVIDRKELVATGEHKGAPLKLTITVTPVAVYDDDDDLVVLNDELMTTVSDPRLREEFVNLDRAFPLMADLVRRQGIDLPLPYGISLAYRKQTMDIGFFDFDIMGLNLNEFFDPTASFGTVDAQSLSLRGDVNILPFWNVYALVGRIKVDAAVNAQYTGKLEDILKDKLGEFGGAAACRLLQEQGLDLCSGTNFAVPLDLDYTTIGVGTTLSIGYKEFFASVNATWVKTQLDSSIDWGDSIITVQPLLGYQFVDFRGQLLVGAEYQGLDDRMTGNLGFIPELGRDFTYDVGVINNRWAYLIGFNKQLGKHYNLTFMYNYGETRDSFTLNFGYRF
ncbi:hypothetical protein [Ferrimonas gelatinilytica]|uniref:Uncharacterized protein n=1 Tax=Ferrimonas gelatinilytica TaxID=1255257 RepID=A0ABP9S8R5_9GAMM